jgi:hypothetical protein
VCVCVCFFLRCEEVVVIVLLALRIVLDNMVDVELKDDDDEERRELSEGDD